MPKCEKILEKTKRKGEQCGIYTNKKYGEKFYCSAHYKLFDNNEKPKELIKETPKEPITLTDNQKALTLDITSGYSLDEMIEQEYQHIIKSNPDYNKGRDINLGRYNELKDNLKKISDKINDLELIINNRSKDTLPEYEIYK